MYVNHSILVSGNSFTVRGGDEQSKGEDMPAQYKSIGDYIRARAQDLGLNTHNLVGALNEFYKHRNIEFGASYINSIVNEQFTPSQKRARLIAEFFGDDPNIILELAGYYQPPDVCSITL